MTVEFCPSKVLWGHNAGSVTKEQFQLAVAQVKDVLELLGIGTRVRAMKIQRMDWKRDVPVQHMGACLEVAKRLRPFVSNPEIGYEEDTGVCYGSKKVCFCFYDKRAQLRDKEKHRLQEALNFLDGVGEDVLRVEVRVEPDAPEKRKWKLATLGDLEDFYERGVRVFEKSLADQVFRKSISPEWDKEFVFKNNENPKKRPRLWELGGVPQDKLLDYFVAAGLEYLYAGAPIAEIYSELKGHKCSRSTRTTLVKKIKAGRPYLLLPPGVPFGSIHAALEAALLPAGYPAK